MRLLPALAALFLAAACNAVSTVEPLGTTPLRLDPLEWDGTWLYAEGSLTLKVIAPEEGRISMVAIDESNDSLEPFTSEVTILQHGDWVFANLRPEEEPERNYWMRVRLDGTQLIAWYPSPKAFATSVRAGDLPGTIDENGNVHLEVLTQEHIEHIVRGERELMLLWEEPQAFLRVSQAVGL